MKKDKMVKDAKKEMAKKPDSKPKGMSKMPDKKMKEMNSCKGMKGNK